MCGNIGQFMAMRPKRSQLCAAVNADGSYKKRVTCFSCCVDGHYPINCPHGKISVWRTQANKNSFFEARAENETREVRCGIGQSTSKAGVGSGWELKPGCRNTSWWQPSSWRRNQSIRDGPQVSPLTLRPSSTIDNVGVIAGSVAQRSEPCEGNNVFLA